jgi:predicted SAM-dependent methyltransferase
VAIVIPIADPTLDDLDVLEIGGGDCFITGAIQVDAAGGDGIIKATWGDDRLPFADNSFDLVYSSHCLEHIHYSRTRAALGEAYRVLRPGGRIELWVPNFYFLMKSYWHRRGHEDGWIGPEEHQGDHMYWFNARVFSGREEHKGNPLQEHRALFDGPYLTRCLERAGFINVRVLNKTRTRDHYQINMGRGAEK